jgi:hypothetical protein
MTVVVIALLAIPVSWRLGQHIYEANIRLTTEQAQTRHPVRAVITSVPSGIPVDYDSPMKVSAQWRQDGQLHTERVVSPVAVEVGAALPLWTDDYGQVVSQPLTPADAVVTAVGAGWLMWTSTMLVAGSAALVTCACIRRYRDSAWDRAHLLLTESDGGRANRHP